MIGAAVLSFHAHTRSTNFSRPRSWRGDALFGELALDDLLRGDAGVIGAGQPERDCSPLIRSKRTRMSCSVLLSAWPMCSDPVTFGGGMTMQNGSAPGVRLGLEGAGLFPSRAPARLNVFWVECGLDHRIATYSRRRPANARWLFATARPVNRSGPGLSGRPTLAGHAGDALKLCFDARFTIAGRLCSSHSFSIGFSSSRTTPSTD